VFGAYGEAAGAVFELVGRPTVVAAMYPMQPDGLLGALLAEAERRHTSVRLYAADLRGRYDFIRTDWLATGLVELVTIGGRVSRRVARYADPMPCSLWEISRRFADGTIPVDVFAATTAPPDAGGYCGFGPVIAYGAAAAGAARYRVADVNASVLPVPGHPGMALEEVAVAVDAGPAEVPALPDPVVDDAARAVGELVAGLVPDGATLQLGLGTIPQALCGALGGRRDLGIHTGSLPEGAIALLESGVVTGARKSADAGLHVATSLLGSARLYGYAHEAAHRIVLRPVGETHDPAALRGQDRLVAVNSALEVDLAGQVNAEAAGGVRISSAGGQADFMRAGHLSAGGAAVIALASRTRTGASRIVRRLADPHCVTTPSDDVDYVVTEYGVADLRGRSGRERRDALIAVAAPEARDGLRG
jgi:4-hydroxybutyrate CoA-transferase